MTTKARLALFAAVLFQTYIHAQTITDTITYPIDRASAFYNYGEPMGGYFNGTNHNFKSIGHYYSWPASVTGTGGIIWCGAKQKLGTADSYSIGVYNAGADSLPTGGAVAAHTFTTDDMDSSTLLS